MMNNRWIKSSFWFILQSVVIYISVKYRSFFTCETSMPLNGWESLILIILILFFLHKFIISAFINLSKDHRGGLFFILAAAYFVITLGLTQNSEIDDLKENGGIVISSKIIDKLPSQKSNQKLKVVFYNNDEIYNKLIKVSVQDFKKKQRGDTVLLLYSPTCRSTGIGYDLYPSQADIKKCLNGCDFEYNEKLKIK